MSMAPCSSASRSFVDQARPRRICSTHISPVNKQGVPFHRHPPENRGFSMRCKLQAVPLRRSVHTPAFNGSTSLASTSTGFLEQARSAV